MTEAIETFGLTKSYGQRRGIVEVDLAVHEGEVFGFLGPNGAGKTTTIRVLLGLLRPTSGRAVLLGLDAWLDAPVVHRRLAHLGSDPAYLGELTARDQLGYLARLRGLAPGCWRDLAERLELDPSVHIRKLSRGNRQKIGVVQAFMGQEPLLVLDEPTTGLDPLMQREFLSLVAAVRAEGRTVFLSSHNLPEVERSCDRVGIIREGRLTEITTVQALLAEHWRSINLVLETPPEPAVFDLPGVQVVNAAARDIHLMVRGDINPLMARIAALRLVDISITTPDMEDVFLRFYGTAGPGAELAGERPATAASAPGGDR